MRSTFVRDEWDRIKCRENKGNKVQKRRREIVQKKWQWKRKILEKMKEFRYLGYVM